MRHPPCRGCGGFGQKCPGGGRGLGTCGLEGLLSDSSEVSEDVSLLPSEQGTSPPPRLVEVQGEKKQLDNSRREGRKLPSCPSGLPAVSGGTRPVPSPRLAPTSALRCHQRDQGSLGNDAGKTQRQQEISQTLSSCSACPMLLAPSITSAPRGARLGSPGWTRCAPLPPRSPPHLRRPVVVPLPLQLKRSTAAGAVLQDGCSPPCCRSGCLR